MQKRDRARIDPPCFFIIIITVICYHFVVSVFILLYLCYLLDNHRTEHIENTIMRHARPNAYRACCACVRADDNVLPCLNRAHVRVACRRAHLACTLLSVYHPRLYPVSPSLSFPRVPICSLSFPSRSSLLSLGLVPRART